MDSALPGSVPTESSEKYNDHIIKLVCSAWQDDSGSSSGNSYDKAFQSTLEWISNVPLQEAGTKYSAFREDLYTRMVNEERETTSESESPSNLHIQFYISILRKYLPVDFAVTKRIFKVDDQDSESEGNASRCPNESALFDLLYNGVINAFLKHLKRLLPVILSSCHEIDEQYEGVGKIQKDETRGRLLLIVDGLSYIMDGVSDSIDTKWCEFVEDKVIGLLSTWISPFEPVLIQYFQSAIMLLGKVCLLREAEWYNAHNEYHCCMIGSLDTNSDLPAKIAQSCADFVDITDQYVRVAVGLHMSPLCGPLMNSIISVLESFVSRLKMAAVDVPRHNPAEFLYIAFNTGFFLHRYSTQWSEAIDALSGSDSGSAKTNVDVCCKNIEQLINSLFDDIVGLHVSRLRCYFLSDIEENEWRSTRPYRGRYPCTRGLLSWYTYLMSLPVEFERDGLPLVSRNRAFSDIARCRLTQFNADLCFLLFCFASFAIQLGKCAEIEQCIEQLMFSSAIMLAPLTDLIACFESKNSTTPAEVEERGVSVDDTVLSLLYKLHPGWFDFTIGEESTIKPIPAVSPDPPSDTSSGDSLFDINFAFCAAKHSASMWADGLKIFWSPILKKCYEKVDKNRILKVLQCRPELQSDVFPKLEVDEVGMVKKLRSLGGEAVGE